MKQIVITWGYSTEDGKPELDCYLEIADARKDGMAIKMMDLRGRFNSTNKMALFNVDESFTREDMAEFIESNSSHSIALLKKASIRAGDVLRTAQDNNAIDFIMSS